jgi:two-component system sensor histidine kinase RegB
MRGGGVELNGEAPRLFRLEDVLADLRGEFLHEKQEVQVAFEGTVPTNTDMYSLQQALASSLRALLRNAVQACSGVGSVVCRTEISDDEIAFSVQDSGPGMTEEVAERAGEPFFTSKEPGEGMGLGLYLTKLFARQVGGALSISSVAGKGTRVLLRIPRIMEVV